MIPGSIEEVTAQVIDGLRHLMRTKPDWKQGWTHPLNGLLPFNAYTGAYYTGLNLLWLFLCAKMLGAYDNRWLTFVQIRKMAEKTGRPMYVRKGEKASWIIRPYFLDQDKTANEDNSRQKIIKGEPDALETLLGDSGTQPDGFIICAVFNASQIEGMPPYDDGGQVTKIQRNRLLEKFIASSGILVKHEPACSTPCYHIDFDQISMPYPGRFNDTEEYYAAKLHEFFHATGHHDRENRLEENIPDLVGYSQEEARAEIFSVLAGALLNLPLCNANAAAYISNYLENCKGSGFGLLRLTSQAAKIMSLLLEYALGKKPAARWFPPKKAWPELIKKQKQADEGLPGF